MDGVGGSEAAIDQLPSPLKYVGRQHHSTLWQKLKNAAAANFVGDRCGLDFRHARRYLLVLASVDRLQNDRHGVGFEPNACLRLIVERPIQAGNVEIDLHEVNRSRGGR